MSTPVWHGVVTLMVIILLSAIAIRFRKREISEQGISRHLGIIDLAIILVILVGIEVLLPSLWIWSASSRF
jgi:heme/copper-type cytochrome/quinol oxidase subunit 2